MTTPEFDLSNPTQAQFRNQMETITSLQDFIRDLLPRLKGADWIKAKRLLYRGSNS